jgi:hypothetical protein
LIFKAIRSLLKFGEQGKSGQSLLMGWQFCFGRHIQRIKRGGAAKLATARSYSISIQQIWKLDWSKWYIGRTITERCHWIHTDDVACGIAA